MATIKKAYEEIVAFLQANEKKTVSEVIADVIVMAAAKTGSGGGKATAFHRNEEGEVVAIKCYYHKLWMDPRVVDFGKKATSPTGLNNMCKDGVSKWTKQQRESKIAESTLLTRVTQGDLAIEDIAAEQVTIAEQCSRIDPRDDEYGFETLELCVEDSAIRADDAEEAA